MRLKIDWASRIVGSKFTVFALFSFAFQGNFPSTRPRGGLYLEGRFNGGSFTLPVWRSYIWRGLFMEGRIFGILQYFISLLKWIIDQMIHNGGGFLWITSKTGYFGYITRGVSLLRIRKE